MSNRPATGFYAIHANHLEDLRRAVVHLCRHHPLAPLQNETFLVQSNGIAQWLKLALAEQQGDGLGIAAGMDFLFPARFIWQAYRAVLPAGEVPEQSPFDKRRMIWRLYRLLPQQIEQRPSFAPLARFLSAEDTDVRRFQLAEKIADLFDQYQVFRADWLAQWEAGNDVLVTARAEVRALPEEMCWQPQLWRSLLQDVGGERSSRAHIHTSFMQQGQTLAAPANDAQLPKRIIVFGVSSLPRQALEALSVLSRFSQVVLCVHNPCQYFWSDIISDRDLFQVQRQRGKQHPVLSGMSAEVVHQHAPPLLAAWGKQGRDYIRLLDEFDDPSEYSSGLSTPEQKIDIFSDHGDAEISRLLHDIQNDILHLRPLSEIQQQNRVFDHQDDRSLVFHSAHSPQREVEILHDQLLAAFNADPTLRPRDVMVMVPDINVYTPHIQAVFGRHLSSDKRFIPFTISDQGQRHQQPLLIALETLLSLPTHRFSSSDILSLLEVPALRARFGIDEDEVPLARQWVEGSNIRWGLHSRQRESLDLPPQLQRNTWQAGLRRMLMGYGLGDDAAWMDVEPYTEVAGLQASLAGRLYAFVQQLEWLWQALQTEKTYQQWQALLADLLDRFFDQSDGDDLVLLNRFRRQLEQWREDCEAADIPQQLLPLNIVKDVLLDGLDEGGLNQRFLAGKVNFATLMPMRAIPFRHVCLLGMNDGDYPRSHHPVDFDLMATDYRPGDRSRREDDRYLFLEALLSARDALYISWVGRSIRDDSERPPSVLVSQLQDYVDTVWQAEDGRVTDGLTQQHPLQPFSRQYFPTKDNSPEATSFTSWFTYETEWRQAHTGVENDASSQLVYQPPSEPLTLAELAQFLKYPVETFYQRRLQVQFASVEQPMSEVENFALDGLTRWRLDQEIIEQVITPADSQQEFEQALQQHLQRLVLRGDVGMGVTEQVLQQTIAQRLPDLFERYHGAKQHWCMEDTVRAFHQVFPGVTLASENSVQAQPLASLEVADWLTHIRLNQHGERCRLIIANSSLLSGSGAQRKVRYRNLIPYWLVHLAGQLTTEPFVSQILAKEEGREFTFPQLPRATAHACLTAIVHSWQLGMTRPLSLHCDAAFAWIGSFYQSKRYQGDGERADKEALAVYELALERDPGYLRGADIPLLDQEFYALLQAVYLPLWQAEQGVEISAPNFASENPPELVPEIGQVNDQH
ncbi:exodeoxyribonuclease V subunit gamma [Bacterioplanes sanyensis]|uniref:RecBCD enzyme subunit RecC n=1 Tax=Bacterioplanes sanyensis TaxID=1249553 RepID=A0A222FLQ6_9GAMM|nr:exodeoxyribonuclease V subunit gamma [Bacterioplanes sanyensis]ASP39321.1 exodeoxyribonuclease V subunit gamma [Bacterioplanes sanyensis]